MAPWRKSISKTRPSSSLCAKSRPSGVSARPEISRSLFGSSHRSTGFSFSGLCLAVSGAGRSPQALPASKAASSAAITGTRSALRLGRGRGTQLDLHGVDRTAGGSANGGHQLVPTTGFPDLDQIEKLRGLAFVAHYFV